LHEVEGVSHAEASGVLGICVGNERIPLHRGPACLREILEADVEKN
jgi:DNA-directed RNA polymerase specialized sigma24 family protein